jgi:NADH dehydrogenase (ubiquinone) 1 alpha/beta subcomplex 1
MRTVAARIARPLLALRTLQFQTASFAAAAARPALVSAPKALQQVRFASSGSLSKDDISNRVLEVLKSFEKVDPAKVG